jgi:glycosyltransferase involved in cell wall biosynthesis
MRIAVDARELCGQSTGVGTYLANLLAAWQRMPETASLQWRLYVPGGQSPPRHPVEVGGAFTWRTVPGKPGTWWEQKALAEAVRRDGADVFFAPGYSAPLAIRAPVVLAVHDVSFFAHPEWFRWREGLRRRFITGRSARMAAVVLTISQFSSSEITRTIGIDPGRIRVIYPGVAAAEQPDTPRAVTREPIVLFVGSIFNRRRVPDLIRAFAAVARTHAGARLELVGENRTHPREDLGALAASLGVAGRVRLHSYASDAELLGLYRQASVFAFLSEYEGFGFTPLEALVHGVPSVVLDTPVAREIYQDAAMFVAPGDVGGTAGALSGLLADAGARAAVVANGRRVLARYSWAVAARETLRAIEEAR